MALSLTGRTAAARADLGRAPTLPRTGLGREVATLAPPAILLLAVLQVATDHGARHGELALAGLTVLVTQILPGAIVWRLIRPVHGWLVEDLAMGFAVGAALAVPCHVLGVLAGQPWLDAVLPIAVAGTLLAVPGTRLRIASRELQPLPWAWGVLVTVSCVGPLLNVLSADGYPVRWRGWATLYVDMPYHDALAAEVMHHVPPHYPQAALEPLAYHWFAHAWTAQIATVSGTGLDVLLWRADPALLLVAAPVATAVAAMRLTRRAWAGPPAALLAYLLPAVNPWSRAGLRTPLWGPLSPTQQFSALLIVALLVLLVLRWRGEASRWSLPVLGLLLVITGGAKGSTLPVVLLGSVVALVALVVMRARGARRTVALDVVLTGVVFVVLDKVMFGGGDGGVSLDLGHDFVAKQGALIAGHPVEPASPLGVATGVLAVLVMLLGPLAGLALLAFGETRRDPLAWLMIGGAAAGVGAVVGLTHPGASQFYFYLAGMPCLVLAGIWGTVVLVEHARARGASIAAAALVGALALPLVHLVYGDSGAPGLPRAVLALATLLVLLAAGCAVAARLTGTGTAGTVAGLAVALVAASTVPAIQDVADWQAPRSAVQAGPKPGAVDSADVRALRWLRDHSDPDDLVMTNKHCRTRVADPCDRRRFVIGAYAERAVLIEGWTYTRPASRLYSTYGSFEFTDAQFWDQGLLALNDGFIRSPTAAAARRLWNLGVRWVVVWQNPPHAAALSSYARLVQRGRTVRIYRLAVP